MTLLQVADASGPERSRKSDAVKTERKTAATRPLYLSKQLFFSSKSITVFGSSSGLYCSVRKTAAEVAAAARCMVGETAAAVLWTTPIVKQLRTVPKRRWTAGITLGILHSNFGARCRRSEHFQFAKRAQRSNSARGLPKRVAPSRAPWSAPFRNPPSDRLRRRRARSTPLQATILWVPPPPPPTYHPSS